MSKLWCLFPSNGETAEGWQRGATVVETAITIGLFLFIVGGGLQLMVLAYNALTLQIVANTTIRNETIGNCTVCVEGACSACNDAQRANRMEDQARSMARTLGITIGERDICIKPASAVISCNTNGDDDDAGRPRQMVVLTITRNFSLLLGLGTFTVQARALGKNEPFGAGVM